MTIIEQQFERLRTEFPSANLTVVSNGGYLVEIPGYVLPSGWSATSVTVIFFAPPGYPAAQPDCFWIEPGALRLQGGGTPQATNDTNPVPGVGQRGTWFSWHLQTWNPNSDSLLTYANVITQRLFPAR
jgi:hypothetical protein